ncbi:hypothetical protein ABIE38_002722 [Dietzia sp. 2505]
MLSIPLPIVIGEVHTTGSAAVDLLGRVAVLLFDLSAS